MRTLDGCAGHWGALLGSPQTRPSLLAPSALRGTSHEQCHHSQFGGVGDLCRFKTEGKTGRGVSSRLGPQCSVPASSWAGVGSSTTSPPAALPSCRSGLLRPPVVGAPGWDTSEQTRFQFCFGAAPPAALPVAAFVEFRSYVVVTVPPLPQGAREGGGVTGGSGAHSWAVTGPLGTGGLGGGDPSTRQRLWASELPGGVQPRSGAALRPGDHMACAGPTRPPGSLRGYLLQLKHVG